MKINYIVGIIGILLLVTFLFSLSEETSPGEYVYDHFLLLNVVIVAWLVLVVATMIFLMVGKWYTIPAILSTVLFVVILILTHLWVHCVIPYERSLGYELWALFSVVVVVSICEIVCICEIVGISWRNKK